VYKNKDLTTIVKISKTSSHQLLLRSAKSDDDEDASDLSNAQDEDNCVQEIQFNIDVPDESTEVIEIFYIEDNTKEETPVSSSNNKQTLVASPNDTITSDVESCMDDLLREVEKLVKKKKGKRKRPVNKDKWVINKRCKAVQSGQSHTNNKGKFIKAKKINNKKDCASKCKFKCSDNIDQSAQENIFN